jgi:hypothetical protein
MSKQVGMNKYIGKYRVRQQHDVNDEWTSNEEDTFVLCRGNIQLYRWNDNTLAIYFPIGKMQTANTIFKSHIQYLDADYKRSVKQSLKDNDLNSIGGLALEHIMLIEEKHLDKFEKTIFPQTSNRKLKPTSKKNLPNYNGYKIKNVKKHESLKKRIGDYVEDKTGKRISPHIYTKIHKQIAEHLKYDIYKVMEDEELNFMEALDFKDDLNRAIIILNKHIVGVKK